MLKYLFASLSGLLAWSTASLAVPIGHCPTDSFGPCAIDVSGSANLFPGDSAHFEYAFDDMLHLETGPIPPAGSKGIPRPSTTPFWTTSASGEWNLDMAVSWTDENHDVLETKSGRVSTVFDGVTGLTVLFSFDPSESWMFHDVEVWFTANSCMPFPETEIPTKTGPITTGPFDCSDTFDISMEFIEFGAVKQGAWGVPEPITLALMTLGMAGIGYSRRRAA